MADNEAGEDTIITLTADIVAAHVSNNSVAVNDLPNLILDKARLHRLPRMREEAEDAEAPSHDQP